MYEYKSFKGTVPEIIKHFELDIKGKTIYDRLKKGMTITEAIEKPIKKHNMYEYKGFKGTLPEIIKYFELKIKRKTIYDRLSKGMAIDEAIEFPLNYNITMKSKKN